MTPLYGVIGIFDCPEEVVSTADHLKQLGYTEVEAFSPFPIENIEEFVTRPANHVASFCLLGGVVGCLTGFLMQYYAYVIDFPLNVGGRPNNSWPAFIPITFELTILFAAFFAVVSMFVANGLPKPYHPIFNSKQFSLGSGNRFCVCIKSKDQLFNVSEIRNVLQRCNALSIEEIEL